MMMRILLILFCGIVITGCGVSKSGYNATRKYSLGEVSNDYSIYQNILEHHHPGLYWYTSRDSMNYYFEKGRQQLRDSMTEPEFKKILTYVTARINCGHTSVRSSKKYLKYLDTVRIGRIFPLSMKLWNDTIIVAANLNRRDSILQRGTVIKGINGRSSHKIIDTLFDYISTDGYNRTHKFQTLSNRGSFGSMYSSLFGLSATYSIDYIDTLGKQSTVTVPVYSPSTDTFNRRFIRPTTNLPQPSRKERREIQFNNVRLLQLDTVNKTAMMNLASFGRGYGLKKFFRQSFRELKRSKVHHLIIDVRSNGGGSVTNSTFITRYLSDHRFKVGDSLYAIRKGSKYDKYIANTFFNKLFMTFFTRKKKDGNHHFGYFERHYFKPKNKNHFDGKVYVITGGNSFSATTLMASTIREQENVTIVGEETGGGAYGNSAWLIPDVKLPVTGLRFRLPLFRLVIDQNTPKNGRGVQPEVFSLPSIDAVQSNADYKLQTVMELIRQDKQGLK